MILQLGTSLLPPTTPVRTTHHYESNTWAVSQLVPNYHRITVLKSRHISCTCGLARHAIGETYCVNQFLKTSVMTRRSKKYVTMICCHGIVLYACVRWTLLCLYPFLKFKIVSNHLVLPCVFSEHIYLNVASDWWFILYLFIRAAFFITLLSVQVLQNYKWQECCHTWFL
jgi:hypothetical protein